jgi:SAM-dependent methyltransferase
MTDLHREGAAGWNAIADGWTDLMRTGTGGVAESRRLVLDPTHLGALGDIAGKRVLDAGCGEGRFARMLAERGAQVTAFDLSERMIANARSLEEETPLGIDYRVVDMADLGELADGSFDMAIAYLSIIDVLDYERAIAEIARVLVPGGRFHFSIVHPCHSPPDAAWEPRTPGTFPVLDRDKLYKKIDNYYPARELRFRMWPTAPAETLNYHRPLSDYAHTLRAAGLRIVDVHEPYPPEAVMAERDYLREHYRAPFFMMIEAVKP